MCWVTLANEWTMTSARADVLVMMSVGIEASA